MLYTSSNMRFLLTYLHLKPQSKFEEILSTNGTHSLSSYNCGCKYLMTKKFKKTKFIGPLVHTYICICYWIFKWFLMCIIIFWMTICKNNRKWVFLKTNLHLTSNRLPSAISSNCIKPRLVHNHFILSM